MRFGFWPFAQQARHAPELPSTAYDERIYAIGDAHGRLDLLHALLRQMETDVRARGQADTRVIFLGDFIDRGPYSKQILHFARKASRESDALIFLLGNHEELLLESAQGNPAMQRLWMQNGGDATIRSYGLDPAELMCRSPEEIADTLFEVVGEDVIGWLDTIPLTYQSGDYFFCHAGIRPGVPLTQQRREDLLWIRDRFTRSSAYHGAVIVHGHSEVDEPVVGPNRINVDTAAYRTGVLSAVGLEGTSLWLVSTAESESQGHS